MEEYRIMHDTMGEVRVSAKHLWGAQTQRSLNNFPIGTEKMPSEIIRAFALLKKAAAETNHILLPGKITEAKCARICEVCDEILEGKLPDEFPLSVWQTGSGTQTNMNVNEVIAYAGSLKEGRPLLHPNDDVNCSQSSNDTFPTAMSIAAAEALSNSLLPAVALLKDTLLRLEKENEDAVKSGRTHLMDAVPIRFSQEISGWRTMMEVSEAHIREGIDTLMPLAIGGTAVGTGLNAPEGFGRMTAERLSAYTGLPFRDAENKFHALTSLDRFVFAHGAVKGLAADLMKIANDIRWLASGPRLGLSEIRIPENEPGSSIMPGKVNPTQCEAMTMIAVRVMGNDTTIGMAASQGNFELNVFLPVTAYSFLQSVRLLSDGIRSFTERCVSGIRANRDKMCENLNRSLMLVTALSPRIGYENAAKTAKCALEENLSLKEACVKLGFLSGEEFDRLVRPEEMT